MADDWKSYVDLDGTHVIAPANAPTSIDGLMERMGLHPAQIVRNVANTEVYALPELLATAWQMADFGARSELVPRITALQARIDEIRAAIADFERYGTNGPRTPGQMLRDVSDILDREPGRAALQGDQPEVPGG